MENDIGMRCIKRAVSIYIRRIHAENQFVLISMFHSRACLYDVEKSGYIFMQVRNILHDLLTFNV